MFPGIFLDSRYLLQEILMYFSLLASRNIYPSMELFLGVGGQRKKKSYKHWLLGEREVGDVLLQIFTKRLFFSVFSSDEQDQRLSHVTFLGGPRTGGKWKSSTVGSTFYSQEESNSEFMEFPSILCFACAFLFYSCVFRILRTKQILVCISVFLCFC